MARIRFASAIGSVLVACIACGTADPSSSEETLQSQTPREPVALAGSWLWESPKRLAGDTLTLRKDKTAQGVIPWDGGRDLRVSSWEIRFGSKDSVASRSDWRQGFTDGGDSECFKTPQPSGCISLPMLCIGVNSMKNCRSFALIALDTLVLSDGSRFRRVARPGPGTQ